MANSMYVPLTQLPEDLAAMSVIVEEVFREFGVTSPIAKFDTPGRDASFLRNFVLVEGQDPQARCWVSFSECSTDISERAGYNNMADIQTRGAWNFAALVAYALCKYAGYVVRNDGGELDGQVTYSVASLRAVLLQRL